MVFTVRCFKCGAQDVKLILGGRQILHARCQSCQTNLLAEILAFEQTLLQPPPTAPTPEPPAADDAPTGDVPAPSPAPQPKQSRKPGRDTQPTRELKPISKQAPSSDETREMKLPDPDPSKA